MIEPISVYRKYTNVVFLRHYLANHHGREKGTLYIYRKEEDGKRVNVFLKDIFLVETEEEVPLKRSFSIPDRFLTLQFAEPVQVIVEGEPPHKTAKITRMKQVVDKN